MLTQKECAHLLGVSIRTVQRWVRRGFLPRQRPIIRGLRRIRYSRTDVDLIMSHTRQMATGTIKALAN